MRAGRAARILTVVFAAAGSAVRVQQFATRRSLWVDEAMLALNVIERGYRSLAHPLQYNQGAPVGWLWTERLMVQLFGANEYALRVVPLVAGLATVVLVALIGSRMVGPWAGAAACGLVAFAPAAVRYSTEVKQYSSDAAVACVLLLLAVELARAQRSSMLILWAVVGAAAVWFSHPAVFALTGLTLVLGGRALARRDRRGFAALFVATLVWAASFGAAYLVSLRRLGHNDFLTTYWQAGMAPRHGGVSDTIRWSGRVLTAAAADPGHWRPGVLGAFAVLAGLVVLGAVLRRPLEAALLASVLALGFGVAVARRYPFQGRLALYALPVGAVSLGALVEWAAPPRVRIAGLASGALVVALAARPVWDVGAVAHTPLTIGEVRPVMQQIRHRERADDQVWVHGLSQTPVRFYADLTGVAASSSLADGLPGTTCEPDGRPISDAAGRVWVVFAYRAGAAAADEQPRIIDALRGHGHLVDVLRRPGAAGYLIDFGQPPDLAAMSAAASGLPCLQLQPVEAPPETTLTTGPFGSGRAVRPPLLTD